MWRKAHDLPEELILDLKYLGGDMPTFALNFFRRPVVRSPPSTATSSGLAQRSCEDCPLRRTRHLADGGAAEVRQVGNDL
jgi:hypothetical protein